MEASAPEREGPSEAEVAEFRRRMHEASRAATLRVEGHPPVSAAEVSFEFVRTAGEPGGEPLADWEREFLEASTTPVRPRSDRNASPEITRPEPLPDGVLGYNVATLRSLSGGGWLATTDLMGLEEAGHVREATGGVLVEFRAVQR